MLHCLKLYLSVTDLKVAPGVHKEDVDHPVLPNGDVHGDVGLRPVQFLLQSQQHFVQQLPPVGVTSGLSNPGSFSEDTEVDFGDCPTLNISICRANYIIPGSRMLTFKWF